jgi:hypothetical protein
MGTINLDSTELETEEQALTKEEEEKAKQQIHKYYEAWKAKEFSLNGFTFSINHIDIENAAMITTFCNENFGEHIPKGREVSYIKKEEFKAIKKLLMDNITYKKMTLSKFFIDGKGFFNLNPSLYFSFFSTAIAVFASPLLVGDSPDSNLK